jgi:hypothetical protein
MLEHRAIVDFKKRTSVQFERMKPYNGLILKFKSQIYQRKELYATSQIKSVQPNKKEA